MRLSRVVSKPQPRWEEMTIRAADSHGGSLIQSKKVEVTFGPADSTAVNKCSIMVNSDKILAVGKEQLDLRPRRRKSGYLSCIH